MVSLSRMDDFNIDNDNPVAALADALSRAYGRDFTRVDAVLWAVRLGLSLLEPEAGDTIEVSTKRLQVMLTERTLANVTDIAQKVFASFGMPCTVDVDGVRHVVTFETPQGRVEWDAHGVQRVEDDNDIPSTFYN